MAEKIVKTLLALVLPLLITAKGFLLFAEWMEEK